MDMSTTTSTQRILSISVGDLVPYSAVPDGAMVLSDIEEQVFSMRLNGRGVHVGGPASWAGFNEEARKFGTWTWSGYGLVKVVALGLVCPSSGKHALAPGVEVRTLLDAVTEAVDVVFAGPNTALRAPRAGDPRSYPCPTCREPDCITEENRMLGYQCDYCADRAEGRGGYE